MMQKIIYYGVYVELEFVPFELPSVSVELELESSSPPVKLRFKSSSVMFCEKAAPKLLVTSTTTKMTTAIPIYFLLDFSLFSIMIN